MIEIIYKDEVNNAEENKGIFRIPRNIRQIGLGGGKYRVYIEDYVYTFMNRIAEKSKENDGRMAILAGKAEWNEGNVYVFVKAAVYIDEIITNEHMELENETWKKVQDIMCEYFSELDVVGCFVTIPQMSMEITDLIGKTYLRHFSGGEKILMLMESQEKEEALFYYENGYFIKTPGYYLFYEKNIKMQEYMMTHKWWETSENEKIIPDEAVKKIRKRFSKESETQVEKEEKKPLFTYAATACLVLAITATGINFVRNYQKIQMAEKELEVSAVLTVDDKIQNTLTPLPEKSELDTYEDVEMKKEANAEINIKNNDKIQNETDDEIVSDIEEETNEQNENVRDQAENEEKDSEKELSEEENAEKLEEEVSSKSVLETYMIRPGDTLYQISILNYGNMEAIEEICRMNNISEEENIYPGQIIVLP